MQQRSEMTMDPEILSALTAQRNNEIKFNERMLLIWICIGLWDLVWMLFNIYLALRHPQSLTMTLMSSFDAGILFALLIWTIAQMIAAYNDLKLNKKRYSEYNKYRINLAASRKEG